MNFIVCISKLIQYVRLLYYSYYHFVSCFGKLSDLKICL